MYYLNESGMIFPTQALWGANGILKDLRWDIFSPIFLAEFFSQALGVHNDLHFKDTFIHSSL